MTFPSILQWHVFRRALGHRIAAGVAGFLSLIGIVAIPFKGAADEKSMPAAIRGASSVANPSRPLPFGTPAEQLTATGDLSAKMVAGIDRFLERMTAESVAHRNAHWKRDFSSAENFAASIEPNRKRLRTILGAFDPLVTPVEMSYISGPDLPAKLAETDMIEVHAVRWTVFEGVQGDGLMLRPKGRTIARVVVLPDADQTPEMLAGLVTGLESSAQVARRLAEAGCEVVVPALIDRQSTWSGSPMITMTDQTHREWIWRPAYEVGRHIIGFEVRKVEAALEWLRTRPGPPLPLGVAGYGEGGLIALNAAALDQRVQVALVSGYFQPREQLWTEPIYRNVWSLLREFGDAELASLIAPRALVIEYLAGPRVKERPASSATLRMTAAPGSLATPELEAVRREVARARALCTAPDGRQFGSIELVAGKDEMTGELALGCSQVDHDAGRPCSIVAPYGCTAHQRPP